MERARPGGKDPRKRKDERRLEDVGRQSISCLTIAKTRTEVQAAFPECRAQRAMMAVAFFHPGTFHAS